MDWKWLKASDPKANFDQLNVLSSEHILKGLKNTVGKLKYCN